MIPLSGKIPWKLGLSVSDPEDLQMFIRLKNIVSYSFLCRLTFTADVVSNYHHLFVPGWFDLTYDYTNPKCIYFKAVPCQTELERD